MSDEINRDRRHFFGSAAMTLAAAQLSLTTTAEAQDGQGGENRRQTGNPHIVRITEAD